MDRYLLHHKVKHDGVRAFVASTIAFVGRVDSQFVEVNNAGGVSAMPPVECALGVDQFGGTHDPSVFKGYGDPIEVGAGDTHGSVMIAADSLLSMSVTQ